MGDTVLPSGSLKVAHTEIPLWQTGSGDKILFAFPGYLQEPETWTSWLDQLPQGWRAVIIGMPGSIVRANEAHSGWEKQDWLDLVSQLRTTYQPKEEAWLGYSLGGRLLLYLTGLSGSRIHRIFLMSPDGLAPSLSEKLFLYHRLGQRPLKWLINQPETAKKLANFLRKIRLMNQSGHHFIMRQLRDLSSLESGYHVVRIYTRAQPSRRHLRKASSNPEFTVWAIWGESDNVRPIEQSRSLWKYFRDVHLTAVPGGHTWPRHRPELLQDWLEVGLQDQD